MMIHFMILLMFFSGALVYSIKRNHLLLMLLSLEFMVVSLYFFIYMYMSTMSYDYFFSMLFLSFSVCEGALGLSVLVSMIRSIGNDYIMVFSSLW
uniref:NADH dehydrogenase subunit 4L n=1 Tax=Epuraea terminalis TaxID=1553310 RepID=UPI0030DE77E2